MGSRRESDRDGGRRVKGIEGDDGEGGDTEQERKRE